MRAAELTDEQAQRVAWGLGIFRWRDREQLDALLEGWPMSEICYPDKLTPCSPADLYATLRTVWPQLMAGEQPGRASLLVLLAHWALETGFGHYCHHWNLGNSKHVPGDGHCYTMFRCNEIIGGKVVWYDPPDPATWFVAYPTLSAGASAYLVALRGQFRGAWPAVLAGDPAEFCHQLKLARYYTADEGLYTAGVVRCYHQLDASIPVDGAIGTQAAVDEAIGAFTSEIDTQPEIPTDPPEAA